MIFGKTGFITREEHDETIKRMESEHKRLNHRMEIVEKMDEKIYQIITSIEKMSANVENMLKAQERQEKRIEGHDSRIDKLESKDSKKWNSMMDQIWKLLIAAVVGYILSKVGLN